ncbi:hypothetical protein PPTG_06646 [Phytophthora nicotianae INRA-310]|uniref:Uncharacterized protein n=1 Tax=Phytophthora nicotianae (strain INRA-310) TaxID=761204 RepID=W2QR06_PHYN3|nr:hypothetical protein PPTG_06646 [Phytophthora nicotianae INRA-310]ETN15371.1 hypothetical protein PPTG_06646 [Phytophthora nicotianae INRA-310]
MDDMDVEPADDAQIQSWLQVKLDPEQMIGDSITRTWKIQRAATVTFKICSMDEE